MRQLPLVCMNILTPAHLLNQTCLGTRTHALFQSKYDVIIGDTLSLGRKIIKHRRARNSQVRRGEHHLFTLHSKGHHVQAKGCNVEPSSFRGSTIQVK